MVVTLIKNIMIFFSCRNLAFIRCSSQLLADVLCPLQVSTTLTLRRLNAGAPSPSLASIYSTLGRASCFAMCRVTTMHVDTQHTDPMPSQCCNAVAGQHPVNTEQCIVRRSHECRSRNGNLEPML